MILINLLVINTLGLLIAILCNKIEQLKYLQQNIIMPKLKDVYRDADQVFLGEHPYLASVMSYKMHMCTGAIISKNLVLTAARCFSNVKDSKKITIRVGSTDVGDGGDVYQIARIVLYNGFYERESSIQPSEERLFYDVACLKTNDSIIFSEGFVNDIDIAFVKRGRRDTEFHDLGRYAMVAWARSHEWTDYNLMWNDSEYGGVKDLRITPNKLWKPDVLMYNSADEGFDGTYHTNVVVKNNGSCLYVPPGIFKSTCKIDITWFPFDDQHCDMKFGSWTYDGNQINLNLKSEDGGDLSDFITNGEWYLLGMPGKKNTIVYQCCPEPYVDVTFTIQIRRRTLYYFFNLIVPCVLISSMALLGFTLPPDSGEKLTLGVTILLSLTVFLNLVAETLPQVSDAIPLLGVTILLSQTVFSLLVGHVITKTSDAIPLIGTYFNCIMFMVASSVVLTVVVLNYHHRTADIHEMPQWIKSVFLQWLPWILGMSRPGKKITRKTIMMSNRMRELELKERSSKSLLANVLDIDDDFRHVPPIQQNSAASTGNLGPGCSMFRSDFRRSFVRPSTMEDVGAVGGVGGVSSGLSSNHRELHLILRELQFITNRMKKADEEAEVISDWKFAAMVVDRFCLIIFTMFTIIATMAVLFSAPHIIVQ